MTAEARLINNSEASSTFVVATLSSMSIAMIDSPYKKSSTTWKAP